MEETTKSTWIEAALDRYESRLVRYAAWILGDVEPAREVVQETFLRLCKENPSNLTGHLAQWLFTVCRNLSFDVRKKENRMRPLEDSDAAGRAADSPLQNLDQAEAMSQVVRIMERLPKNQREVLRLKFQEELSYKEISAITNLSVTNVGFLIHTAIKTLRKEILRNPPAIGG